MISKQIAEQPKNTQMCTSSAAPLELNIGTAEPRVDSRLLAQHLHNKHQSLFELIKNHRADFEELGLLRFQTGEVTGGRPEKFAMLNEDQSTLALSYSKNTPRVRQLKVKLVKAFREARRAAEMHDTEYLPAYHQVHDQIKVLAKGAPDERFDHMNLNRLINKVVGVSAGGRSSASTDKKALLTVALMMANMVFRNAPDRKSAYQSAKRAIESLATLSMGQAS